MRVRQSVIARDRAISADTTAKLAQAVRELSEWIPVLRRLADAETLRSRVDGHSFEITAAAVHAIIAGRKLREEYFWPSMDDDAWSVLLELFASRLEGRRVVLAELCQATDLKPNIAQHWADWLAGRGLVSINFAEGEASPIDLTDAGADSMRSYLLASLSLSPWVQ